VPSSWTRSSSVFRSGPSSSPGSPPIGVLARLEQLELAAVVRDAELRAPPCAAGAANELRVDRAEARVVELAIGRVEVRRPAARDEAAPAEAAARTFRAQRRAELAVDAFAVQLDAGVHERFAADGVGHLGGDHVDDAAERLRAVQHACGTADDLDAVGETRIDRRPSSSLHE
jgi:hypothetical protein